MTTTMPPAPGAPDDGAGGDESGPALEAVLFDMDGTLIDSEPYWFQAETQLVQEHGGDWTHGQSVELVGQGLDVTAGRLKDAGVRMDARDIIELLTDRVLERIDIAVPWRPGAQALLAAANEAGLRTALVTMSIRRMAERVAAASVASGGFDTVVSFDDVHAPKPDPEAYRTALRTLGVRADRAVAIEDSEPGLASAVAAGIASVGVPHMTALAPRDGAMMWPTLAQRNLDDLARVLHGLPEGTVLS